MNQYNNVIKIQLNKIYTESTRTINYFNCVTNYKNPKILDEYQ